MDKQNLSPEIETERDKRVPLPETDDYELVISNDDSKFKIHSLRVIGYGGSCIVYKGIKHISIDEKKEEASVVVKEFYPVGLDIERTEDMCLRINDEHNYNALKAHFVDGQLNHIRIYEWFRDQILPRPFMLGYANNTVYSVSDPWEGRTLSSINLDTLKLSHISSIMESICSAIDKIHTKECVYLDCKPDNFFCYHKRDGLEDKVYLFDFDTVIPIEKIKNSLNDYCTASYGWAPPEQELIESGGCKRYKAPSNIGYHTDIYSIGAIFFWLLTHRKPTSDDIKSVLNHSFDWEKESNICSGEDSEVINKIQDIVENSLQPDIEIRSRMFHQYISTRKVFMKQFSDLYGYKVGDTIHFEPIHSVLTRLEEELLEKTDQILDGVKELSKKIEKIPSNTIADQKELYDLVKNMNSRPVKDNKTDTEDNDFVCPISFNRTSGQYIVAKDKPDSSWQGDPITIKPNQDYFWVLTSINNCCPDRKKIAESVRLGMQIEQISGFETLVTATITCPNATPQNVSHEIHFKADFPFSLEYIPNSAYLYSQYFGKLHSDMNLKLGDDIMDDHGTLVGFSAIDGRIPGGMHGNNRVTVSIKVKIVRKNN